MHIGEVPERHGVMFLLQAIPLGLQAHLLDIANKEVIPDYTKIQLPRLQWRY